MLCSLPVDVVIRIFMFVAPVNIDTALIRAQRHKDMLEIIKTYDLHPVTVFGILVTILDPVYSHEILSAYERLFRVSLEWHFIAKRALGTLFACSFDTIVYEILTACLQWSRNNTCLALLQNLSVPHLYAQYSQPLVFDNDKNSLQCGPLMNMYVSQVSLESIFQQNEFGHVCMHVVVITTRNVLNAGGANVDNSNTQPFKKILLLMRIYGIIIVDFTHEGPLPISDKEYCNKLSDLLRN